jgi:two-component system response regulator AtoC
MASVLVIDDEEGFRSFLCDVLSDAGHDVTAAHDGTSALSALARSRFDLVLTDLKMPGPDGVAVVRHVHALHPGTPVVVITAHASVETAVDTLTHGAVDYLKKPLESPAALRALVSRILSERAARPAARQASVAPDPPLTWGAPAMEPFVSALRRVARTPATVLILGESGTGKELAARALHRGSPRAEGAFAAVNCGALAPTVLESELFGHEKGAFTGAVAQHQGRIERAKGGTFFLDEIGELQPEMQVKLLRVLQERTFERVGGSTPVTADVRWVTATHRDLRAMVRAGTFREDLYHRIAVVPLRVPPLRERREDIAPLARHLLADLAAAAGLDPVTLSDDALARLESLPWPGNVRELRNVLERALILSDSPVIRAEDLAPDADRISRPAPTKAAVPVDLKELERDAIARALLESGGNRRRAAEKLGIGLRTLYEKLKRYDLA